MGQILITNTGDSEVTVKIERGQGSRYMSESRTLTPGQSTGAMIGGDLRVSVAAPECATVAPTELEKSGGEVEKPAPPKRRRRKPVEPRKPE